MYLPIFFPLEKENLIKKNKKQKTKNLYAWGNDSASEGLTKAHLLLVENSFENPS